MNLTAYITCTGYGEYAMRPHIKKILTVLLTALILLSPTTVPCASENEDTALTAEEAAENKKGAAKDKKETEADKKKSGSEKKKAKKKKAEFDAKGRDVVFIGDSRIVLMYEQFFGGTDAEIQTIDKTKDVWSAKGGATYDWIVRFGIPYAENYITKNSSVIIASGVNDTLTGIIPAGQYTTTLNQKAREWTALGAKVYFCSVLPTYDQKCHIRTSKVEIFNTYLREHLAPEITYLDMGLMMPDVLTGIVRDPDMTDEAGIHFAGSVNVVWYNTLEEAVGGENYYDAASGKITHEKPRT